MPCGPSGSRCAATRSSPVGVIGQMERSPRKWLSKLLSCATSENGQRGARAGGRARVPPPRFRDLDAIAAPCRLQSPRAASTPPRIWPTCLRVRSDGRGKLIPPNSSLMNPRNQVTSPLPDKFLMPYAITSSAARTPSACAWHAFHGLAARRTDGRVLDAAVGRPGRGQRNNLGQFAAGSAPTSPPPATVRPRARATRSAAPGAACTRSTRVSPSSVRWQGGVRTARRGRRQRRRRACF